MRSIGAVQSAVRAHRKRCPHAAVTVHLAGDFELHAPLLIGPEVHRRLVLFPLFPPQKSEKVLLLPFLPLS